MTGNESPKTDKQRPGGANENQSPTDQQGLFAKKSPGKPATAAPLRIQGHPEICADHLLSLYRNQKVEASSDAFLRQSGLHMAKRYYAELRGSTMIVFRNAEVAASAGTLMRDIIAVLVIKHYNVGVEKKQGQSTRIRLEGPGLSGAELYVKPGVQQLEGWLQALATAESIILPCLSSMTVESVIGQGGGGKVFLVHDKQNSENFALKVIDKKQALSSPNALKHVVSERNLMEIIGSHPFVLPMKFAFQSDVNLFIGTPFCGGGDFATYLKNQWKKHGSTSPEPALPGGEKRKYGGHLPEEQAVPILAEMILALEYLHEKGVVYRDLKPENIMISTDGHIRLGDFGLAKHLLPSRMGHGFVRTSSICGTRNYLPPEMLFGRLYSIECDMWSLGILVFRTLCGRFPFEGNKTKEVFSKVKRENIRYPDFLSPEAKSFMTGLLVRDQERRKNVLWAKNHPFMTGVDFNAMMQGQARPAIPNILSQDAQESTDVLEHFDVSKIQDLSMGEQRPPAKDGFGPGTISAQPQTRVDPEGQILGFEYAEVVEEEAPPPLSVKRVGSNRVSGMLEKLHKTSSGSGEVSESPSKLRSILSTKRSMPHIEGQSPKNILPDRS